MIASTNLLVLIFYIHVALAHILPRQTSSYPIKNKTISSSPIVTPGRYLPSGDIKAGRHSHYVSRTNANTVNGTIFTVSPANANINTSLCPFVVQDTINIKYWPSLYGQELDSLPFNITSIVTAVTHYIDTIITRYTTNVIVTSTRSSITYTHEESFPYGPPNDAQIPWRSVTELKKDADLISWNSTFSPSGTTYIYPTARIITVPAVTQENGQLACTTAITRRYFYNEPDLKAGRNPCGMRVFTGMNSNVQRYFDSSRFSFHPYPSTKSVGPAIDVPTHGLNNGSIPDVTSTILTTKTEIELVFATPFAHEPSWNVTNLDDYGGYNVSTGEPCPGVFDHAIADYGYVPQAFIEFITQEFPEITSDLPPGATLLAGGPSIMDGISQVIVAPATMDAEEDLTVSTAFTIRNTGCFHPDLCLTNDDAPTIVATTTASTTQSLVQRPNSPKVISTQASKTTFRASLANTHRETSVLESSAVASTSSVASSAETVHSAAEASITTKPAALPPKSLSSVVLLNPNSHLLLAGNANLPETAHPAGDAPVTTKAVALPSQSALSVVLLNPKSHLLIAGDANLAETALPTGDVPITTKAAALPSQSASSVVMQISESNLLLGFERIVQESFAAYLLPSIGPSQHTSSAAPKDILASQTLSLAAGSPIGVYKTTSGSAPQVSEVPGPVIKIGSQYLTAHSVLEYTVDRKTPVTGSTPIVVSRATHSIAAHVSAFIVNGVTSTLSINPQVTTFPEVKTSSQYLTLDSSLGYILGSITLIPGAIPIVFSGITYSLAPEASILVANGVTSILHEQRTLPASLPKSTPTGSGRLQYILAGQTLSPDMPTVTVSGLVISLAALGNTVVIDGTPFPFPTGTIPSLTIGSQLLIATPFPFPTGTIPSLTIDSQLLIATPASDLFVSDQVSQVGSAASTTSDGNARNTTSATNVTTSNTNRLLSTLATTVTSEVVPPVPVITGKASRGGFGFPQMLRLSLVVLGLILLQAG